MSKTILVTGASSGIGYDIAYSLHEEGHHIIGLSRTKPLNCPFTYYTCDLSKMDDMKSTVSLIKEQFDQIDALIHCAGVGTGGAMEDISYEDLFWVFQINVFSVVELTKQILPLLRESSNPKIINIGSVAGEITIPFQVSYSMSKSSISRLTEGLRIELHDDGIDVCTVLPGDTKTGFTNNRKVINPKNSNYHNRVKRSITRMETDEQSGVLPSHVSNVIKKLLHRKKMPRQVIVGFKYKMLVFLYKLAPDCLKEKVIRKMYG